MKNVLPIKEALDPIIDELEAKFSRREWESYLRLGLKDLDRQLIGFAPGEVAVICSHDHKCLAAFVQQGLVNAVTDQGKSAFVYPGDLCADEYAKRLLSAVTQIDLVKLDRGHLGAEEWRPLSDALTLFTAAKFWIDKDAKEFQDIYQRAKELAFETGIQPDLVLVHSEVKRLRADGHRYINELKKIAEGLGTVVWLAITLGPHNIGASMANRLYVNSSFLGELRNAADKFLLLNHSCPGASGEIPPKTFEVVVLKGGRRCECPTEFQLIPEQARLAIKRKLA